MTCSCSSRSARPSSIIPLGSWETTSADTGPSTRSQIRLHDLAGIAVLLGEQRGVRGRSGEDAPGGDLLHLGDAPGVDEKPHCAAPTLRQPPDQHPRPARPRARPRPRSSTRRPLQPSSSPIASATGVTDSALRSCRRGEDPEAGPPQQHVGDRARLLEAGGDHRLGEQVGAVPRRSGAPARGARAASSSTSRAGVPVAEGELLQRAIGQVGLAETFGQVEILRPRRHPERDVLGAARRHAPLALDHPVDDLLRHAPPSRQLAARDRQHPRGGLVELGLARDVHRLAWDRRSRSAAGPRRRRRSGRRRPRSSSKYVVDRLEQVVDVVGAGLRTWSMSPS